MISLNFFVLLAATFLIFWLLPSQKMRNICLIVSSFVFLYVIDKRSLAVVSMLSVFSYLAGILIARMNKKGMIHFLGVTGILLVLVLFRYIGLLNSALEQLTAFRQGFPAFNINRLLLPLGLSYLVFKHISYLTDVKWGLVKPGRFMDFLLYSSLFTIYAAGPIERFVRFKPQVESAKIAFSTDNITTGSSRIIHGLFKKLVLADWLGFFINPIWQDPGSYSTAVRVLALLGYSLQIYFDFSGYSDLAIGSSRLFGIRIMENFNHPYLAANISQFWKRWHISLSDWIRDYVFFPLSRLSSKKVWTMLLVPVTAMALCGLWHGSTWHFLLWGIWHGLGLAGLQFWQAYKRRQGIKGNTLPSPYPGMLINFLFVTAGWLLFRDNGFELLLKLLSLTTVLYAGVFAALVLTGLYLINNYLLNKFSLRTTAFYALLLTILLFGMMETGFVYAGF